MCTFVCVRGCDSWCGLVLIRFAYYCICTGFCLALVTQWLNFWALLTKISNPFCSRGAGPAFLLAGICREKNVTMQ